MFMNVRKSLLAASVCAAALLPFAQGAMAQEAVFVLNTSEVGAPTYNPIKATMLKPALDSLERIVAKLQKDEPDIAAKLGTAGALCVRLIRGSNSSVSNHSFGTAIDITLQGELDPFADGTMQIGLIILAEHFNEEGWYWGGGYNREDGMHFEVGEETLQKWVDDGLLPSQ